MSVLSPLARKMEKDREEVRAEDHPLRHLNGKRLCAVRCSKEVCVFVCVHVINEENIPEVKGEKKANVAFGVAHTTVPLSPSQHRRLGGAFAWVRLASFRCISVFLSYAQKGHTDNSRTS